MGSPMSGILAEIFLQYFEETHMKQHLEHKDIIYYKRYVDDICIIYDQTKTNSDKITNMFNKINDHLELKATTEENNNIQFLDLSITRNHNNMAIAIYRKPTHIDITINFTSNHPHNHKLAAFIFYIDRMSNMPIDKTTIKQEWLKILEMAKNNGFPKHLITQLRNKLATKRDNRKRKSTQTSTQQPAQKKWITFTYYSPAIRKVTNLFKQTNINIAYRSTNTIYQQLAQHPQEDNPSGIYQLRCNTCNKAYIGQSGRDIAVTHKEHIRYIRNNNPTSAYAAHILQNKHEYGPAESTLKLLKPCKKGKQMDCWESLFINMHHRQNVLIEEQAYHPNPLLALATAPNTLHSPPAPSPTDTTR
jgi:hypothetical protein